MSQTPAHEFHNPDLLDLIPATARALIEVGCSSGALAREFKKVNPSCNYLGIDVEESYLELARRYCDEVLLWDIEQGDDQFFKSHGDRDCWIFGDALEHLKDPWGVLKRIQPNLAKGGCVVACIPNAQHWSVVARLAIGDFRYEDSGLLDRTHLRWFTRQTIIDLFGGAGFQIVEARPRIFDEPASGRFVPLIGELAKVCGVDPAIAMNDSLPYQYVVRAVTG